MAALAWEALFFDSISDSVHVCRGMTMWCLFLESNTPSPHLEYFCSNGGIPELALSALAVVPPVVQQKLQLQPRYVGLRPRALKVVLL